jgi:hypothetical protein
MSPEIIKAVLGTGLKVYMRSVKDSYLYFTDGTRVGYLQYNPVGGLQIGTVHKPNTRTGTGFMLGNIPAINREELDKALVQFPFGFTPPLTGAERDATVPFANMDKFLSSSPWNKTFTEITSVE